MAKQLVTLRCDLLGSLEFMGMGHIILYCNVTDTAVM